MISHHLLTTSPKQRRRLLLPNQEAYEELVRGKNVLLLGPAPYVIEGGVEYSMSEFDTVVRLNKSVEMVDVYEDIGTRTDILYHCLEVNESHGSPMYDVSAWKERSLKHLRITYPPVKPYYLKNIERFLLANNGELPFSTVAADFYNELCRECNNTSPNSGLIAILDILRHNPERLHISGLTFLRGDRLYFEGYRDVFNSEEKVRYINSIYKNHSIDFQNTFLRKELKKFSSITYDKEAFMALFDEGAGNG